MHPDSARVKALDIARDIVVAKMSNTDGLANGQAGESAADFFEAVYNKVYEIASKSLI